MKGPLVADELIEPASRRLKAIGDPVRMQLLNALHRQGEMNVQGLVDATGQRQANVSKHLGVLAREGLIRRRKEGVSAFYAIDEPSLQGICLLLSNSLRAG